MAAGDEVGIVNASAWGIIGQKHAWPVFTAFAREDFALELLLSTSMPSPGYWIEEYDANNAHIGATTLWEWWRSNVTNDASTRAGQQVRVLGGNMFLTLIAHLSLLCRIHGRATTL